MMFDLNDEWRDPQFVQEMMEQIKIEQERKWESAPGRWANLEWEWGDLIRMHDYFLREHGDLPALPLLKNLPEWEESLLMRYWLEQLEDNPQQTPKNPYTLEELSSQERTELEEFLEQGLFLIRQLELEEEDKELLRLL
ncbi:hypothetical protein E4U03_07745 [Rothia nasimurium]|uniref:Uncharacterized protein n=1 Tax=Rothia nasimurium TaxID=85336 RepID=A0A4Y9F2M1_9MICC|nr:hypothetical protein [Rothia nasimurium]MBF0808500.1 hypothetical protein [Rothia nasimurium]TFU21894.1 hypothetical protein E4U03_07745 [Rothia nasimurium]